MTYRRLKEVRKEVVLEIAFKFLLSVPQKKGIFAYTKYNFSD